MAQSQITDHRTNLGPGSQLCALPSHSLAKVLFPIRFAAYLSIISRALDPGLWVIPYSWHSARLLSFGHLNEAASLCRVLYASLLGWFFSRVAVNPANDAVFDGAFLYLIELALDCLCALFLHAGEELLSFLRHILPTIAVALRLIDCCFCLTFPLFSGPEGVGDTQYSFLNQLVEYHGDSRFLFSWIFCNISVLLGAETAPFRDVSFKTLFTPDRTWCLVLNLERVTGHVTINR